MCVSALGYVAFKSLCEIGHVLLSELPSELENKAPLLQAVTNFI